MQELDVFLDGCRVGVCTLEREGLYMRFSCRCSPPDRGIYRLAVSGSTGSCQLGVPVPDGRDFSLSARVPLSRLPEMPWSLCLRGGAGARRQGQFIPLEPEKPFPYLHRLTGAYLEERDGQIGVVLKPEDA